MLRTLILICSVALPRQDCTPDTARAVVQGPDVVICMGMAPQALLASTGLRAERGEYVLVRCPRDEA